MALAGPPPIHGGAIAGDGRRVARVVTARVTARPDLPWASPEHGSGQSPTPRQPPPQESPGNPTDTKTPAGIYTMVIKPSEIQVRFPGAFQRPASDNTGAGWILDSDYAIARTTIRIAGPVTFEPFHDQAEGGPWCFVDGPSGTYEWSISGTALNLTPHGGSDPCGVRGFIWTGQWTRVG